MIRLSELPEGAESSPTFQRDASHPSSLSWGTPRFLFGVQSASLDDSIEAGPCGSRPERFCWPGPCSGPAKACFLVSCWFPQRLTLLHVNSNQCLDMPAEEDKMAPTLRDCTGSRSQQWLLRNMTVSA
ncbi:hypothetical protein COCON_G00196410 [Conger conger]|uniref:Ricin B lectin domain-containing protein n=1 Tax=Conger conger TaxID=82655 RepID=A0A9Q1D1M0_CONCO|nr:hypothetical protein COCON_G00196410 [Conger conger]